MPFTDISARTSATSPPSVDPDLIAWKTTAFGWETTAEAAGHIVTISARNPSTADFECFGDAWNEMGSLVTPSNPYIFQYDEGDQYITNIYSRLKHREQQINVKVHPGGVVVRGKGPETRLLLPQEFRDIINDLGVTWASSFYPSAIILSECGILIRDMTIGFHSGTSDTSLIQRNEYPYAAAIPAGYPTICDYYDPSMGGYAAQGYGCSGAGDHPILIDHITTTQYQQRIMFYRCVIANQYDMIINQAWKGDAFTASTAPKALFIIDSCNIYGYDQTYGDPTTGVHTNADTLSLGSISNASFWLNNCTYNAYGNNRLLWMAGTTTSMRPEAAKIWITDCNIRLGTIIRGPAGAVGYAIFTYIGPVPASSTVVISNTNVDVYDSLVGRFTNLSSTTTLGGTYKFVCAVIGLHPAADGSSCSMYMVNVNVNLNMTGLHDALVSSGQSAANVYFAIIGNTSGYSTTVTSGAGYNILLDNTRVNLIGSPSDIAHYKGNLNVWPNSTITVT